MFGLRNNYGKGRKGIAVGVKKDIIHAILLETKRFTIRGMWIVV